MKIKNLNPVERHVEKIVLAVAAAAGLYLAYSAWTSPVTATDQGATVTADEVEGRVSQAVEQLRQGIHASETAVYPTPSGEPYVRGYQEGQQNPFPKELMEEVALCMPRQVPAGDVKDIGPTGGIKIAIPKVPALKDLTLEAKRGTVVLNPPVAPPGGGQPAVPAAVQTADKLWVRGQAGFSYTDLIAAIGGYGLPANKILPKEAQRITIGGIEVERRERNADGTWGQWKAAKTNPFAPIPEVDLEHEDDAQRLKDLNMLDANFPRIVNPDFYPLFQAAAPVAPTTPDKVPIKKTSMEEEERSAKIRDTVRKNWDAAPSMPRRTTVPPKALPAKTSPVTTPKAAAPTMTVPQPAPEDLEFEEGRFGRVRPGLGAAAGGMGGRQDATIENLKANGGELTVCFYDDTVQAAKDYQYRARVKIFNPCYLLSLPLEDPAAKNKPWLYSPWSPEQTVRTDANQFFYLTSAGFGGPKNRGVNVRIFQWGAGRWLQNEESLTPGMPVGSVVNQVNFSTGYTVVDIQFDKSDKSDNTKVIFMDGAGQLITRDLITDSGDPKRKELETSIRNAANAAAAAASATPVN